MPYHYGETKPKKKAKKKEPVKELNFVEKSRLKRRKK